MISRCEVQLLSTIKVGQGKEQKPVSRNNVITDYEVPARYNRNLEKGSSNVEKHVKLVEHQYSYVQAVQPMQ